MKNGRNLNSQHDLLCCPFLATPWNSKRFFLFLFSSPNHQPYKTVSWLFIEQKIDEWTSHQEAPFDAPFLNLLSSRFSLVEGGDWNICSIGFNLPNAETVTQSQIQCWYVCSWTFFRQGSLKESIQGTHPLPNHKKEGDEKKTTRRRAEHRRRPTQAKDEGNRQNQQNNQDSATSFPTPNYKKSIKQLWILETEFSMPWNDPLFGSLQIINVSDEEYWASNACLWFRESFREQWLWFVTLWY